MKQDRLHCHSYHCLIFQLLYTLVLVYKFNFTFILVCLSILSDIGILEKLRKKCIWRTSAQGMVSVTSVLDPVHRKDEKNNVKLLLLLNGFHYYSSLVSFCIPLLSVFNPNIGMIMY